jgi:YVTN family beta-propeller protein
MTWGDGSTEVMADGATRACHTWAFPGPLVIGAQWDERFGRGDATKLVSVVFEPAAVRPTASSTIAYDAARDRVWVVEPDADVVTVIDAIGRNRLRTIAVGDRPRTVAVAGDRILVACQDAVHRLSPQGDNLQTYTRQDIGELDASGLFALNLDPDGTSFWTAGLNSGNVYRVDIESGTVLANFNTGPGGVSGLAVYDELGDESIFTDGFESPAPPIPVVATGPSSHLFKEESRCERQFSPRKSTMPHYVPHDIALILVAATDCDG